MPSARASQPERRPSWSCDTSPSARRLLQGIAVVVAGMFEEFEFLLVGAGLHGVLNDIVADAEPGPQLGRRRRRCA